MLCTRDFTKAGSLITHLYWHDDESKQQALSDSSEDIPILSSGEESVTEIHHSSGGQIVGSSPIKELTVNDFISLYGNNFMAENNKYLHQRKYMFEMSSDVKEINRIQVMRFTALNQNSEKSIE